ncbi:LANO_0F04544g1_1 [Lachancea nothofagi CBS 11611]|uniref:LANO_0F04544g1_1 n=1 Tax=Lachancea nothofagi CBS 11611 TaxID=1266666 RepID=A0A1G4K7P0_9SACH|nr:LANO_0F04544g1_1 [Lachancea nothofagi CBS 11611]
MMILNIFVDNIHCGICERHIFALLSRHFNWKSEARSLGERYGANESALSFRLPRSLLSNNPKRLYADSLDIDRESGKIIVTFNKGEAGTEGSSEKSSIDVPFFDRIAIRKDLVHAGFEVRDIFSGNGDTPGSDPGRIFKTASRNTVVPKLTKLLHTQQKRHRIHVEHCNECRTQELRQRRESDSAIPKKSETQFRAVFAVGGMTCSGCASAIERSIIEILPAIRDVKTTVSVDSINHTAVIFMSNKLHVQRIIEGLKDTGYAAQLLEILPLRTEQRYKLVAAIEGITCAACASAITNAVKDLNCVDEVGVNVVSNTATFILNSAENSVIREVEYTIEDCGFGFRALGKPESVNHAIFKKPTRIVNLRIDGMFCSQCPERVNDALSNFGRAELIIQDPISLKTPFIKFKYIPDVERGVTVRSIIDTLLKTLSNGNDSNMRISIVKERSFGEHLKAISKRDMLKIAVRLVAATIFAIPTFVFGVVGMSLLSKHDKFRVWLEEPLWVGNISRVTWILFILSTPVYFFVDDIFHRKAFLEVRALWRQKNNWQRRLFKFGSMNLLICLGTSVAYFSSIALLAISAIVSREKGEMGFTTTYFDSVVFLTLFLLVGRLLETFSKSRTAQAINDLGLLKQCKATLVDLVGKSNFANDRTVEVDYLEIGDYVKISPGESPPIDCIVVQGHASFDESALTGECVPIEHGEGEQIFAGTVNLGSHTLVGKLCALEGESLLDLIVNTVRDGQLRKAPVEKLADSLTGFFVPLIVALAIVTWIVWISLAFSGCLPQSYLDIDVGGWIVWSLEFATSVFVVACPCGIGLAAPTALFVGAGLAAKHGILARGGGAAFQEGSRVSVVCFDKTGTLTMGGKPKVTNYAVHTNEMVRKIGIQAAKELELSSKHPLAAGVKDFINNTFGCLTGNVKIPVAEEIAGRGLIGDFVVTEESATAPWKLMNPTSAILGNEKFMAESKCHLSSSQLSMLAEWKAEGKSVVIVAIQCREFFKSDNYYPVLLLAARDEVRSEAKGVIASLQHEGIECWMISGDNVITATAIAKELGIDNVVAEVLPEGKADKVTWIKETHIVNNEPSVVAMVGDGINDGPALAAADVGIALASGTDLAMTSCDFVLLSASNTLCSLLTLLQISRKVFRRVRFNFGWALVYNMIGIPIAAGVIYPYKNSRLSPVWASAAMAASSVTVVLSSLALRMYTPMEVQNDDTHKEFVLENSVAIEEKFP